MDKFTEILKYRTESQQEDFLEYLLERGLDNKEKEEIILIIQFFFTKKNNWSLVLFIDLTNKEEIVSETLINIYLDALSDTKTFYIKLSILDYIDDMNSSYKDANIKIDLSIIEKLAYSKKDKLIVRNQALLILLKEDTSKRDYFLSQLKINIQKSDDYRNHIRLYNMLSNNSFYKKIPQDKIVEFIRISKKKNLGRAVDLEIKNLEAKLLKQ